ncbi:MAG: hypothetical protein ACOX6T_24280, partial [Myxococcales bacterium]
MMRSLMSFGAALLLALSACSSSDECSSQSDCGPGSTCEAGKCKPVEAQDCSPACKGSTPVCDKATLKCVTCTATEGCPSGLKCDTSTTSSGVCVECLSSQDCTGGLPVCDPVKRSCVVCTATEGCAPGEICDLSSQYGYCRSPQRCTSSSQCSGSTPVCDLFSGTCKRCTATEGCTGGQRCDISVEQGACVDCLMNSDCATPTPICNATTHTCAVCTATEGCGAGRVCDLSVAGGACVGCRTSADCSAPTPACNLAAKECVVCTATEGCGANEVCDLSVAGGACVQRECSGDSECETAEVCRSGRCVPACAIDANCTGGTVCQDGACLPPCHGDLDCGGGRICEAGKCIPACTGDESCPGAQICEAGRCLNGCLVDTECEGDLVCRDGRCVSDACTSNAHCAAPTPKCDLSTGDCVECLANSDCTDSARPVCSPSHVCVADSNQASAQIAAVRAAGDGGGLSLPISGAIMTYLKPLTGSEQAGFFIQAEQTGPAIFVMVDPATLSPSPAIGDRVSFTVTAVSTFSGLKQVTGISGWSVLATSTPTSPLVQQVSSAADLVSALGTYESEIVSFSAAVTGPIAYAGGGHVAAPISTTGVAGNPDLKLRLSEAVNAEIGLTEGCSFTLSYGPMWRYYDTAQPSVYSASYLTNVNCPAPMVLSALATSPTEVRIDFDRQIAPTSVLANGSQFTFTNGLAATGATVNGKQVVVTTTPQVGNLTYVVTVAGTVTDTLGTGVIGVNTALFSGYLATAELRITEVNPNISGGRDLLELVAVTGGTVRGLVIQEDGSSSRATVATLPDVTVAAGDIILVHINPSGTAGDPLTSETTSKNESTAPNAVAGAWDFVSTMSSTSGLVFSHRVLFVKTPTGDIQDAVAFVKSNTTSAPSAFPTALLA